MNVVDRTLPPVAGPIREFDFPEVARFKLDNGLDVRTARVARLPLVSLHLFLRGGEQDLLDDRAGLAVLAAEALDSGTKHRSGTELAERLESLGARLSASAGWEGTTVSLSCLADRLEEAFPLLAETVLQPDFPGTEVDRAREQRLASIQQRQMDPAALASDRALGFYYRAGVPYARPVGGRRESIEPLTRQSLLGYTEAAYRPGLGGGLVVVGDLDRDEVGTLAARHLGAWSGAPARGSAPEIASARRERRIHVVNRPGSVQTEIRVGHRGVPRATDDYFALTVANMLLGGTFTSRLNLNLRERHGFTYGVRSRFFFRSGPGPFEVSTAVGTEVTAPAVGEIIHELERLVAGGPTHDEVTATRDFLAGVFGLQLETVDQIAARLAQLVIYGLADGYFHEYRNHVRSVTVEEVGAAARRHLRPSEVQVVVVGDADSIVQPLESLGVGAVQIVDQ